MKKLLLILLCLPMIGFGQQTYVPDDNFEQELINQGYDDVLDDYVQTSNINTITHIHLAQDSISDLTGIEDFDSLATLLCYNNIMTSLDLSNNTALVSLDCSGNQLTILDVRNGNNINFLSFYCFNNPNLLCINVDDANWTTTNWTFANGNIDLQHYFSNNCSGPTSIQEHSTNKELIKITDVLGRETKGTKNEPLFYIYDDGTVEKRIVIE
jgi:Leucine-rich repeat (LRR) protein